MYAYAYSNFCIEYLFYVIWCEIRPHAKIYALLNDVWYKWLLIFSWWRRDGVIMSSLMRSAVLKRSVQCNNLECLNALYQFTLRWVIVNYVKFDSIGSQYWHFLSQTMVCATWRDDKVANSWEICCACDRFACVDLTNNEFARDTQGYLKNVSIFTTPVWCFFLLFIASILSKTNKTDNFCVVCIKCCQAKVESTRTRPKSFPEDGVFFGCFGILPKRTELLTKFFSIDEVMKIHKRSRFHWNLGLALSTIYALSKMHYV